MIREKKILLMMPSLVKPKKKTNVPPMRKCLTSSALPLYFLALIPDTIGSPLKEGYISVEILLVDQRFIHISIGEHSIYVFVPSCVFPSEPGGSVLVTKVFLELTPHRFKTIPYRHFLFY